jgi:hypothetical protein
VDIGSLANILTIIVTVIAVGASVIIKTSGAKTPRFIHGDEAPRARRRRQSPR